MYNLEKINFRCLTPSEIEVRTEGPMVAIVKDGKTFFDTKVILYKTAIACQSILDEVVGPFNWQRSHEEINGNNYCTVSLWDELKKSWVSKQDVGAEQNFEKEKSEASDSFKRACTLWGIGRELYFIRNVHVQLPETMVVDTMRKDSTGNTVYDLKRGCRLNVAEIYCDDNKIPTALRIADQDGKTVWVSKDFDKKRAESKARQKA